METLSGGEKVKAQMMKLLLTEPTVLLLDEPSNDIDVETLEWLEQFIQNWKHIALFISHDETLIENTANMIIHIEQIRRKTVSRYTIAKIGVSDSYSFLISLIISVHSFGSPGPLLNIIPSGFVLKISSAVV